MLRSTGFDHEKRRDTLLLSLLEYTELVNESRKYQKELEKKTENN